MTPSLKDYETYVAEYEKQLAKIQELNGNDVPFDIGPKLNKAAFSGAFQIQASISESNGEEITARRISKIVARQQLFYATPSQAEIQLSKFKDPEIQQMFPENLQKVANGLTREDLLYGTESARQLVNYLKEQYDKFMAEDAGPNKGKAQRAARKISQIYFGS